MRRWTRLLRWPALAFLALLAFSTFEVARMAGHRVVRHRSNDPFGWLKVEYGIGPSELKRIRELHEWHGARRDVLGRELEKSARVLATMLDGESQITPAIQAQMERVSRARADCHHAALSFCYEVSRVLPRDAAARFMVEMEHQILGLEPQWHATAWNRATVDP